MSDFKILDCTLRDGGYYTDWDFAPELVDTYISSINQLPIDIIEVGYRSKKLEGYYGEYFYLPLRTLKKLRKNLSDDKEIAIMIDAKNNTADKIHDLLSPCVPYCDMIRIAVASEKIESIVDILDEIKKLGLQVAVNLMYMSKFDIDEALVDAIKTIEGKIDYLYLVDSYGSVINAEVSAKFSELSKHTSIPLGFHGHNNIEMALSNTLTAIESNAQILDSTVMGMGRGAGNLKTELVLTYLESIGRKQVNFAAIDTLLKGFKALHESYQWGTDFPYMISGVYSLPQAQVMKWLSKKRYSTRSIVNQLVHNISVNPDNSKIKPLPKEELGTMNFKRALILGGGNSVQYHSTGIQNYIEKNDDLLVIHTSGKTLEHQFKGGFQVICLSGHEGHEIEQNEHHFDDLKMIVIPPKPRPMAASIPSDYLEQSYELQRIDFVSEYFDSPMSIALQICLDLGISQISLSGFDGYKNNSSGKGLEIHSETQTVINAFTEKHFDLITLTPSDYSNLKASSIYG